ncbi:islet cell autoantigen 1-like [Argiope bruennichi]|uniref:islet cell autoantigen 1-like n=1 Tax=Argiope bruennichi TaxID=94029 RepID=UPI002493E1CC|nr:islet cell autoantigen 1-like [Argiope bruennichi]XP_055927408.1 islet cell autoantigen 1-like [Argiope bruennichi]
MNDFRESSALNRMQERYWTTKQAVFKKLGKKDDDCIIASDAELDAKLELFQTIEESFLTLMRVLENYQDKLCGLAQEENAMGRFLKENGRYDKTRAGKVMTGAGKALSFSAQQKLSLRIPLVRLYHEVETFQYRAIVDTLQTVEKMEKARTAYRGALMWMKDVSQQLDPDTCKQMEKFRKVQSNVRKTKSRFDKLKLDTLQKVDLLSFSRCNLFSQALATYQNSLMAMSEKMANTMISVAETTKGYQHYEFSLLKELTETSKKLAEETSDKNENFDEEQSLVPNADKDVLLFFESEYHDNDDEKIKTTNANKIKDSSGTDPSNGTAHKRKRQTKKPNKKNEESVESTLISIDNEEMVKKLVFDAPTSNDSNTQPTQHSYVDNSESSSDLLTGKLDDDAYKSDLELLNEILGSNCDSSNSSLSDSHFQNDLSSGLPMNEESDRNNFFASLQNNSQTSYFLPSQLLDMTKGCNASQIDNFESSSSSVTNSTKGIENNSSERNKKGKQDMSSWYNLFADLDPLANPDLIGKKPVDDINC